MSRWRIQIRWLEEELGRLHQDGRGRGPIRRCNGREAVRIDATAALQPEDVVTSTHRGHTRYVGRGVPLAPPAAEIPGRATGRCSGGAGHTLVADPATALLGPRSRRACCC